jgi:TRAP-type mannitol/chloroaromatic compound transport system permease small subunit
MTIFKSLNLFILWQNRFQRQFGHAVAWLAFALVLMTSATVLLRYGFDFSNSKLDESLIIPACQPVYARYRLHLSTKSTCAG